MTIFNSQTKVTTIREARYQNGRWGANTASVQAYDNNGVVEILFFNGFGDPIGHENVESAIAQFDRFMGDKIVRKGD